MNSFSELIAKIGGGVLAIDYGDSFGFSDSVRVVCIVIQGISNHKYVPKDYLLEFPGQIDLSAYVNFIALAHACGENPNRIFVLTRVGDPILLTQKDFLEAMGMKHRCEVSK